MNDLSQLLKDLRQLEAKGNSPAPKASGRRLTPAEIYQRASPSTVAIHTLDHQGNPISLGTGFSVTPRIVVTNLHVFRNADHAIVKFSNGTTVNISSLMTVDAERDLVLVTIESQSQLAPLTLATVPPQVGESVIAIGNPNGLSNSLSTGVVSGIRNVGGVSMIQTTAPISPGSSGGPLFSEYGEVVGVTTLIIMDGQNLNLAIDVSHLRSLLAMRPSVVSIASLKSGINTSVPSQSESGAQPESVMRVTFDKVRAAIQRDDLASALQLLAKIDHRDKSPEYWTLLGEVQECLGNYSDAVSAYNSAATRDSKSPRPFRQLAFCIYKSNDFVRYDCVKNLNDAVARDVSDADSYNIRGILHFADRKPEDSRVAFSTALKLDSRHWAAMYNRELLEYALKMPDSTLIAQRASHLLDLYSGLTHSDTPKYRKHTVKYYCTRTRDEARIPVYLRYK